jgi:hypothetical protein
MLTELLTEDALSFMPRGDESHHQHREAEKS